MKTERVNVLDHGFVELIDVMGDDQAIVDAARVSIAGDGVKAKTSNATLIRYLYRNRHTTPFEMCELKFHVRVPMDTWRQWIRHRTASVNEYSTRYSEAINDKQTTAPDYWRAQAKSNKQGSAEFLPAMAGDGALGDHLSEMEAHLHAVSAAAYKE
ncbi:hypothetical protein LCGC14_2777900, partial [marine sediment metagenome]